MKFKKKKVRVPKETEMNVMESWVYWINIWFGKEGIKELEKAIEKIKKVVK